MLKLLGLNHGWEIVRSWCTQEPKAARKLIEPAASYSIKCPEIEKLKDYRVTPNKGFWNNFPQNTKKLSATTKVKIDILQNFIDKCKKHWTAKDKWIANKCIRNLTFGSKIHFKKNQEPFYFSIVNWIKKMSSLDPSRDPLVKISVSIL
jgi:hypothetical protein